MTDETKEMEVILGPYRGQRLTMTVADADAAVNAHWARDPHAPPEEHAREGVEGKEGEQAEQQSHPPLTDEERTAAYEASVTWARAQWDAAAGIEPDPPPPEGTLSARQGMRPGMVEPESPAQRRAREQRESEAARQRALTPEANPPYPTRGR